MTDIKFCTSCQAMRSLEGGVVRQTRGVPRWICQPCLEKKSPSIYKSYKADAVQVRERA
jgi:hypothetical protein